MARVTAAEVKVVRDTKLSDATITVLIQAANLIVSLINGKCAKSFDEPALTQIELYLSAHYTTADDPVLAVDSFAGATNTVVVPNRIVQGIDSSRWGQMANALSEGCLGEFDKDHQAGETQGQKATVEFFM